MCDYETNGCGCGNNYSVNDRSNGCYDNNNGCGCGCGVLNGISDNTLLIIAIIILFILLFCRGNNY